MPTPLTEDQYAILANDILVTHQAEFAEEVAAYDDHVIADAYNLTAVPNYFVWRTDVARHEILYQTSSAGTTFNFQDNGYMTRTPQELTCFHELFGRSDDRMNTALSNVQKALQDIFSGTGNAQQNRLHIGHISRRLASRGERLFATGLGTGGSPGVMTFEGMMTAGDVAYCLRGVPL